MRIGETSRQEIEAKLNSMGDYVKIDYLSGCLKSNIDIDARKFVLLRLAELYSNKGMFIEAAKLFNTSADISISYVGKINDYLKACDYFVKAGSFQDADIALRNAVANANTSEKNGVKEAAKKFYLTQAKVHLQKDKRANAVKIYEKLLDSFELSVEEKSFVKTQLMPLYEKLGKLKEYSNLKRQM
jgi:tetratricopeptide (TPR) repeat protein